MSKIGIGSRVKWTSQKWEKVGILEGVVPGDNDRYTLTRLCGRMLNHVYKFDFYHSRNGSYIYGSGKETYLVSVKVGKTDRAKRGLYRSRQVELCDPGDERDGVYPV